MCQVSIGIQLIRNSGLDNAEHNITGSGPLWRICKEKTLSVCNEGVDAALGKVVANLKPPVIQVFRQLSAVLWR